VLIVGDNVEIYSIFGYLESFSANYYRRFCTEKKKNIKTQIDLKVRSNRKITDYKDHVHNETFGIKEECIWNNLNYFYVYVNISCDIMHDLYEGIYRYDMAFIIQYFIQNKYFSLSILNFRIKYFSINFNKFNIIFFDIKDNVPKFFKIINIFHH